MGSSLLTPLALHGGSFSQGFIRLLHWRGGQAGLVVSLLELMSFPNRVLSVYECSSDVLQVSMAHVGRFTEVRTAIPSVRMVAIDRPGPT